MSISSVDIQEQGFSTARNGYNMQEVDVFLERVAREIDQMQADFNSAIAEAREEASLSSNQDQDQEEEIRVLRETVANLKQQLSEQHTNEAVISDAFIAAQKSANKIKEDARAEADNTIAEAQAKADQIVGEAADERQRIIDEIDRLDKSRASFVDDYTQLIKHFNDEATKVFTAKGLTSDRSIRSAHEPLGGYGAAPSASDDKVRPEESVPTPSSNNSDSTLYGAVDAIDIDDDID
ncbi:MAG: DivIVA domain-containing protein [Coriobacteriales bacterium]|jgi:cell division initiation protein